MIDILIHFIFSSLSQLKEIHHSVTFYNLQHCWLIHKQFLRSDVLNIFEEYLLQGLDLNHNRPVRRGFFYLFTYLFFAPPKQVQIAHIYKIDG